MQCASRPPASSNFHQSSLVFYLLSRALQVTKSLSIARIPTSTVAMDAMDKAGVHLQRAHAAYEADKCQEALSNCSAAAIHFERGSRSEVHTIGWASMLRLKADCHLQLEDYPAAARDGERAENMFASLPPRTLLEADNAYQYSSCESALGTAYSRLGRTTEAISLYERALLRLEPTEEYEAIIELLTLLPILYGETGQPGKGLSAIKRAKSLCDTLPPSAVSFHLERVENTESSVLKELGRLDDALRVGRSCLAKSEARAGKNSVEVAVVLVKISDILRALKDLTGAEAGYRRSMSILERSGQTQSMFYCNSIVCMGRVVGQQGHDEQARELLTRALSILMQLVPADHPTIAMVHGDLAVANRRLGCESAAAAATSSHVKALRRSQTACTGPGCTRKLRPDGAALDVCNNCRRTFYCGLACQKADWKAGHKVECKELIAERAQGEGEGSIE